MDCLARREHSFQELLHKLHSKCPDASQAEIVAAVERLREENLQSDERFVEAYVRYRQNRGYGYLYIRQDLAMRGLDSALISQYLKSDDPAWSDILAEQVLRRTYTTTAMAPGGSEHQRLLRYFQRRGFRDSEISEALAPLLQAWGRNL